MNNNFKTFLTNLILITVVALLQVQQAQAGPGGSKGGGGGKPSSKPSAAEFIIYDSYMAGSLNDLTSDSSGEYTDGVDGVTAEFAGSGNPLLKLGGSNTRFAEVDFLNCTALEGDEYAETSDLLNQGPVTILGISPYGLIDGDGQSVDQNFLGLLPGETGFTLLGIGLSPPSDGRAWSIRFDPAFGAAMATVERPDTDLEWEVNTIGLKAAIVRPALKKGKESKVVVATCEPFNIQYTVTCDDADQDGLCDPK